jgi:hypothetical protein
MNPHSRRQIPHVRIGRRLVRFSRIDLDRWVQARVVDPVADVGRPESPAPRGSR